MGIISEVKCGRCDRRYSGFRSRCPYCGARRNKRGKHANDTDNSKGKLIIGILLILILIVAVVVLIVTSLGDSAKDPADTTKDPADIVGIGDDDITSVDGTKPVEPNPGTTTPGTPSTPTTPDPPVTPEVKVEALRLKYLGTVLSALDFSMSVGESLQLTYETVPAAVNADAVWTSSNESVFTVSESGVVTAVAAGTEELTLTIGGATLECIVRVN